MDRKHLDATEPVIHAAKVERMQVPFPDPCVIRRQTAQVVAIRSHPQDPDVFCGIPACPMCNLLWRDRTDLHFNGYSPFPLPEETDIWAVLFEIPFYFEAAHIWVGFEGFVR